MSDKIAAKRPEVSFKAFKQVCDSSLSLPSTHRCVTKDEREIKKPLGIPETWLLVCQRRGRGL